jgi:transposase InsO family protein
MCKTLGVQRSSYYKWLHRTKTDDELENERIAVLITEYDEKYHHILGYRRMRMYINVFNHTTYSRKRIQRIMGLLGIHSVIRKKKYKYHYSKPDETADNVLKRDFLASTPNEKWATDVSEFKIPGTSKKIYLSAIIDLYDRSIISYVVSGRNDNKLVFDTFQKAIDSFPDAKPIFHSDRGFQYTSKVFQHKLITAGMTQSMSRVAHCIDNCPTEGLWGIIKSEMYHMYDVENEDSLRIAIDSYLDFYNTERLQERFENQTPMQVRQAALNVEIPHIYPIEENKRIIKYKQHLKELSVSI